jgi:hypothetical protein
MMKMIGAIAVALILAAQMRAEAQTKVYGPDGRSVGTALPSRDGSVRYYDAQGRNLVTPPQNSDGTTKFYNAGERPTGNVQQPTRRSPPRRCRLAISSRSSRTHPAPHHHRAGRAGCVG